MTEPKRWIDEGPPLAIERLLDAAQAEEPREQSMSRTLAALGVVAGTASAATTAGAAASGKATGLFASSALVKWGLMASAVTAVGVTGRAIVRSHFERAASHAVAAPAATSVGAPARTPTLARSSMEVARAAPDVPAPSALAPVEMAPTGPAPSAPAPDDTPPASSALPAHIEVLPVAGAVSVASPPARHAVAPSRSVSVVAPAADAPVDAERLADEVALVDHARGALAQGDARAAIGALDAYDARFAQRRFVPESLYLRMESLLALGRAAEARAVAERLASGYPKSPQAARARQVLSEPNP
jgi:hypothetical protein